MVERLGSQDLNRDGEIINLAIVGSSRFYDFWVFEDVVGRWVDENGYPDLVIVGGASGVDYMAERGPTTTQYPSPCSPRSGTIPTEACRTGVERRPLTH